MFMEEAQKHSFVVFKVYLNLKTDDDRTGFEQFISFVGRGRSRPGVSSQSGESSETSETSGPYRTGVWCQWIEDQ